MSTIGQTGQEYDLGNAYQQELAHKRPQYDLSKVYQQAFGHVRPPYPTLLAQSGTFSGLSPVGTIRALKGSFNFNSKLNTAYTLPTKLDGYQLPNEPTLGFRGGKRVIETELNRGDRVQNVLEELSLNNYQIRLRGIIINEENFDAYPEVEVRRLREIFEKPGSISIENGIAAIFNIQRVEIRDFDFLEVRGYVGAQAYEVDMLSDEDFDLELVDEPERL